MKVTITNYSSIYRSGRNILQCVALNEATDERVLTGELPQVLMQCKTNGYEIVNAQEVLETIVLKYGHGA